MNNYLLLAVFTINLADSPTSSGVDQRPRLKRKAANARSLVRPIASNTAEGIVEPAWQAEPVDAAISGI